MKKIFFMFIVCFNSAAAQQKTEIKDSVLLSVLDNFIDELKLEEREYKIVRVRLICFNKSLKAKSVETTNVGDLKGLRIETEYDVEYSIALEYEVNAQTATWDPVAYYSVHRKIPILLTTGFESLIQGTENNRRELMRVLEKSSNSYALTPPIIWIVDVYNKKVVIRKLSNER